MRICLLSFDVVGPVRNGGIGTAFSALAEQLVADGHDVTLAFCSDFTQTLPLASWVEAYARQGVRFEPLYLRGAEAMQSWQAYRWLAARRFDVVHFHEWRGIGFFAAVARRSGLALRKTALVCQLHSPTGWHRRFSDGFVLREEEVEIGFMERRSAELADLVFSPSAYMLDWVRAEGWRLPGSVRCHPNLLPAGFDTEPTVGAAREVEELVFFGRLEERKGLALFCAAVSRLLAEGARPAGITFLGKVGEMDGGSALGWIHRAAREWDIPWQLRNDLDVLGARDFLAQPGRLAVIASASENSPYTVLECIAAGTPFLAADVGGVAELVAPEDRGAVLFARDAAGLAKRLAEVLRDGARPARPALPFEENVERWRAMQQAALALAPLPPAPAATPLVSVCVTTFNRPHLLAEALASLEAQTYPALEVVVVDDASTDPAAQAFLDAVAPRLAARGWTLLRLPENGYLGAARNAAVAASRGEWVLFLDDDNVALPEMVERYVAAALSTGAEILSCQVNSFVGEGPGPRVPPPGGWRPTEGWVPLGGPVALGILKNCFGDAGFLMRRSRFDALGGFTTDRAGFEDWELLLRAALGGTEILCLPDVLYHYRVDPRAMLRGMSASAAYRSHARVARAWATARDAPEVAEALRLAVEMRVGPRYPGAAALDAAALNGAPALRAAAREALDAGQPGTARRLLEQAFRLHPADPAPWLEALALPGASEPDEDAAALIRAEHASLARRAAAALRARGRADGAAILEDALARLAA